MSSFDEAFKRQVASQRSADAATRSVEEHRRRAAEAAVPEIKKLLRDFCRTLREHGVRPASVELPQITTYGFFGKKTKRQFSPDGYKLGSHAPIGGQLDYVLLLIPDERFWSYVHNWKSKQEPRSGYIDVTAQQLLSGLPLDIVVTDDGEIGVRSTVGHDAGDTLLSPVEEKLASMARYIIDEHQKGRS